MFKIKQYVTNIAL